MELISFLKGDKMKKTALILLLGILIINLSGCLIFKKVGYDIKIGENGNGSVVMSIEDIKSDAVGNKEFEEDKTALFEHMWKSNAFLEDMKYEGKVITERELYVENDLLMGKVKYNFEDITRVEGIQKQDGFYFLTLDLKDSVVTTNGEVIYSDEHKRIIWDEKETNLKFEMLPDYTPAALRDLAPFLKQQEK